MSPAEARDALERAFPGMEWRLSAREPDCIVGKRDAVTVLVRVTRGARFRPFVAAVADSDADDAQGDDPVSAACAAIWNARAHLANQIAALDAATEKP